MRKERNGGKKAIIYARPLNNTHIWQSASFLKSARVRRFRVDTKKKYILDNGI